MTQSPSASSSYHTYMSDDLILSINQDCDCLCVTHKNSIAVFSTITNGSPRLKTCITQPNPVFSCTMLHKTNVLAFVSGAKRKKIRIYDDIKQRTLIELDSSNRILRLILRRDCITVLSTRALCVYALNPTCPSILYELPMTNIHHVATSTSRAPRYIVVTETQQVGHIQVLDLTPVVTGQIPSNHIILIKAHDSRIRAIAVSPMGDLIATASDRGTLIRIWDTYSGSMVKELRRGADPAVVHSLLFSANGSRVVIVSDKATVHLFHMSPQASSHPSPVQPRRTSDVGSQLSNVPINSRSNLAFFKPLLPSYFNSEWSFASCRIPFANDRAATAVDVPPLLAWIIGDSDKVMIASADGRIWRFTFDCRGRGGEGVLDGVWRVRWQASGANELEEVPVIEDL